MKRTTKPLKWNRAKQTLLLLEAEEMYHELLILAVGYYTGLRIGDMLKLKYADFDHDRLIVSEQKTSKQRDIPVIYNLKRIVTLCKKKIGKQYNDYLFVRKRVNQRKHISLDAGIKRITGALTYCNVVGRHLTGHTLRKTFALRYYELTCELVGDYRALNELSKQLNHSSTDITRRYIGIDSEVEREVFANWD